MQYKINTDPRKLIGKRPNLAEENSLTDKIVSAFSVSPERAPLPPLSPLPPYSSLPHRKKNPKGIAIAGSILNFLPFLYLIIFFLQGFRSGHFLPIYMYPILVQALRFVPFLGGLLLYLAARAANVYRKATGWITLANVVFSIASILFVTDWVRTRDPAMLTNANAWGYLAFTIASLLCMLALCVFSMLMLQHVFQKKAPDAAA